MALTKRTYSDYDTSTPITAENLNDIQDEIIDNMVPKTGGTFRGNITIDKASGSPGSNNYSVMILGNTTPKTSEGHSTGIIDLCGNQSYYAELSPAQTMAANRYIALPDASGTIALNENTFKYKGYLPNGTDLNSLIGVENIGIWAIQDSVVNGPGASWCTLYNGVPAYGQQMIVTSSYIFTRALTGSPAVWGNWRRYDSVPITNYGVENLTVTRTENSFVNAEAMSRVQAFKKGNLLVCNFNLAITNGGSFSDYVKIGKINGWNSYSTAFFNVPGQNVGSQTLACYINTSGDINIYSFNAITSQFFRASVVAMAL